MRFNSIVYYVCDTPINLQSNSFYNVKLLLIPFREGPSKLHFVLPVQNAAGLFVRLKLEKILIK